MAAQFTLNPQDLILVHDDELRTTSLKVADAFGKLHKNIIQRIETLECSEEFASANFSAHVQKIKAGAVERESKYYEMTKDGFMFLVMGFTGAQAARIKEAYINAFNWMAKQLFSQPSAKTALRPGEVAVSARGLESLRVVLKDFRASAMRVGEALKPLLGGSARGEAVTMWTYAHELPLCWRELQYVPDARLSVPVTGAPALPATQRPVPSPIGRLLLAQYGRPKPARHAQPAASEEPITNIEAARRKVAAWAAQQQPGFVATLEQVAVVALGLPPDGVTAGDLTRLGRVMRELRWRKARAPVETGRYWVYQKPRY